MADPQDRAICVTFSLQISTFNKLLDICRAADMNRSVLLTTWIERASEAEPSKPAELAKEPT